MEDDDEEVLASSRKRERRLQEGVHEAWDSRTLMDKAREAEEQHRRAQKEEEAKVKEVAERRIEFARWLIDESTKRWKESQGRAEPDSHRMVEGYFDLTKPWEHTRNVNMPFIAQLGEVRKNSHIVFSCINKLCAAMLTNGMAPHCKGDELEMDCPEMEDWLISVGHKFVRECIEYLMCYGFVVWTADAATGSMTVITHDRVDIKMKRSPYGTVRYCVKPKDSMLIGPRRYEDDHDPNFHIDVMHDPDWETGICQGALPACLPIWIAQQTFLRNDKVIGVYNAAPFAFITSINPDEIDTYVKAISGLQPNIDTDLPGQAASIQDKLDASDEIARQIQARDEDLLADMQKPAEAVLPGVELGNIRIKDPTPVEYGHTKLPANMDVKFRPHAPYRGDLVALLQYLDGATERPTGNQSEVFEQQTDQMWRSSKQFRDYIEMILRKASRIVFGGNFADYLQKNFEEPEEMLGVMRAAGPRVYLALRGSITPREEDIRFNNCELSWEDHKRYLVKLGKVRPGAFNKELDPRVQRAIMGGPGRKGEELSLSDELSKASRGFISTQRKAADPWNK
jgi:hypothetical protein